MDAIEQSRLNYIVTGTIKYSDGVNNKLNSPGYFSATDLWQHQQHPTWQHEQVRVWLSTVPGIEQVTENVMMVSLLIWNYLGLYSHLL